MHTADIVRILNTILCLCYLPLLYLRIRDARHKEYTGTTLALALIVMGIMQGSIGNLRNPELHPGAVMIAVGLACSIYTSFRRQVRERTENSVDDE